VHTIMKSDCFDVPQGLSAVPCQVAFQEGRPLFSRRTSHPVHPRSPSR
jgi:hypothetical protein